MRRAEAGRAEGDTAYVSPSITVVGDAASVTAGPTGGESESPGGFHENERGRRSYANEVDDGG